MLSDTHCATEFSFCANPTDKTVDYKSQVKNSCMWKDEKKDDFVYNVDMALVSVMSSPLKVVNVYVKICVTFLKTARRKPTEGKKCFI